MPFVIEPLGKHHNRKTFSCGQTELDDWFQRRASQDERRNVARVFVASDDSLGVIGFYSLSSFTLSLTDLPDETARKLPRYDAIPAALIGRLARDVRVRGRGIGELLLADAIRDSRGRQHARSIRNCRRGEGRICDGVLRRIWIPPLPTAPGSTVLAHIVGCRRD